MNPVSTFVRMTVAALTLGALPAEATAYQCTQVRDDTGQPVVPSITQAWVNRCIPYFINRNSGLLAGDARRRLIRESFDIWENVAGSDLRFLDLGYTDQALGFDPKSNDNRNVVMAVEDPNGLAFFTQTQIAITVTHFSVPTGEIFDSDIALNAVDFRLDEITAPTECAGETYPAHDLRSILAHEIGHLVGFDHPPDTESTMYQSALPCEIKKRTLTMNDMQGLVDVYPSGRPVSACEPPSTPYDAVEGVGRYRDQCTKTREEEGSSSCRSMNSDPSDALALAGLMLAGLLALRFPRQRGMLRRV